MSLSQYANLNFYSESQYNTTRHHVRGQSTQLWVSRDGRRTDTHFRIEPFSESATTITITAIAKTGKFYKEDILTIFSEGEKEDQQVLIGHLILNETLDFTQDQTYQVSIYPSGFELTTKANAYCPCMMPILSIKNGGMLNINSVEAEAENKIQLFSAKKVVNREGKIDFDGFAINDDDSLALLSYLTKGGDNLYFEIRYYPAMVFNTINGACSFGTGPAAYRGEAAVNFSLNPLSGDDFIKAKCTMTPSKISSYVLDYEFLFTKFCPINLENFYGINYTLDIQSGLVDGYCPIDLAPIYNVF